MKITTPTLLIDKEKCLQNIDKIARKAHHSGSSMRPHFKTHASAMVGAWYQEKGISKCTVSSVSMAAYFVSHGWKDITIAFPYNPLESDKISPLAKDVALNILIESEESLHLANDLITSPIGYFIKIDVGTHRTGIDPRNEELIKKLVNASSEKIQFQGFLAHAGHTYGCQDYDSIKWIFDGATKALTQLKNNYGGMLSYGDTPSCSILDDFSCFEEIRPGNFIFYDWMQHTIGSCTPNEIAVCLACPVVSIHKERNEVVVYGGAVHLSKDAVMEKKNKCFGKAVKLHEHGWESEIIGHVSRISQEHGIIKLSENEIDRIKVGDLIGIIPVHSCLTADLQGHYLSTSGEKIDKMAKI